MAGYFISGFYCTSFKSKLSYPYLLLILTSTRRTLACCMRMRGWRWGRCSATRTTCGSRGRRAGTPSGTVPQSPPQWSRFRLSDRSAKRSPIEGGLDTRSMSYMGHRGYSLSHIAHTACMYSSFLIKEIFNGFLGLSLNDRTILFLVTLLDKTVSVR